MEGQHVSIPVILYEASFIDALFSLADRSGLQDYAIVLARSRTDDAEAKKLLTKTTNTGSGLELRHLVVGKIYLARVLRRLGETKNAETM